MAPSCALLRPPYCHIRAYMRSCRRPKGSQALGLNDSGASGGWTWPEVQYGRANGPITSLYFLQVFSPRMSTRCDRHSFTSFSTRCHALFAQRMILNERWGIKLSVYFFLFRVLGNEHAVIRLPREPVQYGGFCPRFVLNERVRFLKRCDVCFEPKTRVNNWRKSCSLVLLAWTRVNLLPFFCYLRLKFGDFWR